MKFHSLPITRISLFVSALLFLFTGCTPEYMKLDKSGLKKVGIKDYDGAFKDFDSSIKVNDQYWLAYLNRGACYAIQENYEKAIEDFNRSIRLRTNNYMAFDNRGLCRQEMNDKIGALADYRQSIMYNSSNNMAITRLGLLLADMDSCKKAVHYLNIALEKKIFNECTSEQEVKYVKSKCEQKSN